MKRLEVIEFLLEQIVKQLELKDEYDLAVEIAKQEAAKEEKKTEKFLSHWRFLKWDKKIPTKATIKDNLKLIRKLTLELEKEVEECYKNY